MEFGTFVFRLWYGNEMNQDGARGEAEEAMELTLLVT